MMPWRVMAAGLVIVGAIERRRRRFLFDRLGQPEVEHFHRAVRTHLDVGGLQIAMDDTLPVRRFDRLDDLARDGQRFLERDRIVRDPVGQGLAVDQLHDERHRPLSRSGRRAAVLDAVDRGDIGMIQRGEDAGLALEARQPLGIVCKRVREDLDGDVTPEPRVACAVDFAHSAGPDGGVDLVRTETGACGQWHQRFGPIVVRKNPWRQSEGGTEGYLKTLFR
jgi:hypothetical protein